MRKKQKERLQDMRYKSFASCKNVLDQGLRTETQILECGVPQRYIGLAGKWPRSVGVKLDQGKERGKM